MFDYAVISNGPSFISVGVKFRVSLGPLEKVSDRSIVLRPTSRHIVIVLSTRHFMRSVGHHSRSVLPRHFVHSDLCALFILYVFHL